MRNELVTRFYTINTPKVTGHMRLALLADFHSNYGKPGWERLLTEIRHAQPDFVLMCGDMVDDKVPIKNAEILFRHLGKRYPCYYVSGNHEVRTNKLRIIKQMIKRYHITVLDGRCHTLVNHDAVVQVCGIDDCAVGQNAFFQQIDAVRDQLRPDRFAVCLIHQPLAAVYCAQYGFDLLLAGHAHGGQWRIPGMKNGIYAAGEGLFPEFSGGECRLENNTLIVSRGLTKTTRGIPRLFNPPELVMIDING